MQRDRSGRNDFFGFGDPFAGFGGFDRPGSIFPSIFGGRDPFDDPFFSRPFGSMFGPSMFGPRMFEPNMFGLQGNPFGHRENAGFLENQAVNQVPQPQRSKGPIITELNSDDEEEPGETDTELKEKDSSRKHFRSGKEPYVQDPDEQAEEKRSRHLHSHNNYRNVVAPARPQAQSYSFHSSTVTYGGPSGAYYTSSTTRRKGGNGVTVEESKEADTTTGKASHRISRGLHDKGHSVMRRLDSDGRVDTMQTLHNLNEDELTGFDEAWKGNARQHLPGWNQGFDMLDNHSQGGTRTGAHNRNLALPSTEQQHYPERMRHPRRRE